MFRPWEAVLDRWSNLDFKPSFTRVVSPAEVAMWVPDDDERRIRAYSLLQSYVSNKARKWITEATEDDGTASDTDNRREYGDAELLIETTLSSLLGDDWEIVTDDAIGEKEGVDGTAAAAQHEFVQDWANRERFTLKIIESETQSIKFGDSVYALGFDTQANRVRLNVYDPGFYFPQFDPRAGGSEDFPEEIWIAWEFEEENDLGEEKTYVRRHRWVLDRGEEGLDDPECFYEDAIWTMDQAVDDVPFSGQPFEELIPYGSLEIDFIPVVHVPNTVALQEHFGQSTLASILQLLDDIQSTDTDLQASAATTGTPPIAITGLGEDEEQTYGPGTVLRTGDGNATLLDTSRSLDALLKLKDALLERLAVNSRTPESLLGRVKPNEVPSGIALTLSFTPHAGMIKKMRLVRDYKYRLLFKFVLKLSRQNNVYDGSEELFETRLRFGSFLPADAQEAMTVVTQLLEAKAISLETAVQYLVEKGLPISDWVEEINRIAQRDYEGAQAILAITGNPELAAEMLGIEASEVMTFEEEEPEEEDVAQDA